MEQRQQTGVGSTEAKWQGGAEQEQQGLAALMNRLEMAFNRSDAAEIAACFVPDATLINPLGHYATGRQAIEQLVRADVEKLVRGGSSRFSIMSARLLSPDTAFFDASHDVSGDALPGGKMHIHLDGLLKKQGGKWLILDARPRPFAQL